MNRNKLSLVTALPALLSACLGSPWRDSLPGRVLEADGSGIEAGGHCESSALRNALAGSGYDFSEDEVIGYGAAVSFVYLKGAFPFIGGRSEHLRESFFQVTGIPWEKRIPRDASDAWGEVFDLLSRGIPVMLRVDMKYLPYLYGGRYGPDYMSFGWHWITLFKVDPETSTAWVTDTAQPGLQAISLGDLDRARSSETKIWPPRREYAWVLPRDSSWTPERPVFLQRALALAAEEMKGGVFEQKKSGIPAMEDFPSELAQLPQYVPSYLFSPALSYMSASIERNGTGGAAFRTLYRTWVQREALRTGDPETSEVLNRLASALMKAEESWHRLSGQLEEASQSGRFDDDGRRALAASLGETAASLLRSEQAFSWILEESVR